MKLGNRFDDKSGRRFHSLVAIRPEKRGIKLGWECLCDCGRRTWASSGNLTSGNTKSCGCRKLDDPAKCRTHGMTKSAEYRIWNDMVMRCVNERREAYPDYGGRGITVCERWRKFENFLTDMGKRPGALTIERRDNDGPYCKENCYWATRSEQANNRRSTVKISFGGREMSMKQWSSILGIPYNALHQRISIMKWPIDKAFSTPIKKRQKPQGTENMWLNAAEGVK